MNRLLAQTAILIGTIAMIFSWGVGPWWLIAGALIFVGAGVYGLFISKKR
jgi:hypothetical protein